MPSRAGAEAGAKAPAPKRPGRSPAKGDPGLFLDKSPKRIHPRPESEEGFGDAEDGGDKKARKLFRREVERALVGLGGSEKVSKNQAGVLMRVYDAIAPTSGVTGPALIEYLVSHPEEAAREIELLAG
mmetsp:Transcript_10905/g.33168  ORF Transcript_10905/g.33168 Transcript_10905/m.33168 type:complete len:128 (-) Transcript_10905:1203-1586(-)